MSAWTEEEYKQYQSNQNLTKISKSMPKPSKYKNKKVVYYGIEFASLKEGARYLQLKTNEEGGIISKLELQPMFVLQEGFRDNKGKWHRPITYSADFKYLEHHTTEVIEDVKASKRFTTDIYKIKKKLLLYKYKDIDFREVY